MPPAPPDRSDHARGVNTTWVYTLGTLVFGVVVLAGSTLAFMATTFSGTTAELLLILALLLSAGLQVRYCWFLKPGRGSGLPAPGWTAALLAPAAAAWLLGLVAPAPALVPALPLWMALCLVASLLPTLPRRWLLTAGLAVSALSVWLGTRVTGLQPDVPGDGGGWMLVAYGLLFPAMLLSGLWWWEIVAELDRNRRAAAQLAVAEERLRFAADLHDIQGHHLQVIALKSELAERMLDIDVEAARANIHETRIIAKQAMEETRLLVSGYREVALDEEIANAREVLAASGAECEVDLGGAGAGLPAAFAADAAVRRVLALAVREATTNILRHSEAGRVGMRLSADGHLCVLEVSNDGVAGAGGGARVAPAAGSARVAGSGLAGLRERLAPLGGTVQTACERDGRFTLRVQVPMGARAGAAQQGGEARP